jgi:hypothetical protein
MEEIQFRWDEYDKAQTNYEKSEHNLMLLHAKESVLEAGEEFQRRYQFFMEIKKLAHDSVEYRKLEEKFDLLKKEPTHKYDDQFMPLFNKAVTEWLTDCIYPAQYLRPYAEYMDSFYRKKGKS